MTKRTDPTPLDGWNTFPTPAVPVNTIRSMGGPEGHEIHEQKNNIAPTMDERYGRDDRIPATHPLR